MSPRLQVPVLVGKVMLLQMEQQRPEVQQRAADHE